MTAMKTCGHCRRGEKYGVPATVQVRGKNRDDRFIPKAFLCDDHWAKDTEKS